MCNNYVMISFSSGKSFQEITSSPEKINNSYNVALITWHNSIMYCEQNGAYFWMLNLYLVYSITIKNKHDLLTVCDLI